MNYKALKNEIKNSNITIKSCAEKVGMSEVGFHQALNKETLTVATYEKVCELLGLSPSSFFDDAAPISVRGNANHIGSGNHIVLTSPEVKALKQRIKDLETIIESKDTVISTLKSQIELLTNLK